LKSGLPVGVQPIGQRRVRPIVPSDEQELLSLWRETWTTTYGPSLGTEALQRMLQHLDRGTAAMFAGREERGYALVEGRQIVGSAISVERGEVAYLWGMYVRPGQQRSGAGSQLLGAVARDLHPAISLEARVLITSLQAQAFYRARGFRVVGEETTEITTGVVAPTAILRIDATQIRATLG
jgi:ribosomal protein S18 acetylase RimI-like enzyme